MLQEKTILEGTKQEIVDYFEDFFNKQEEEFDLKSSDEWEIPTGISKQLDEIEKKDGVGLGMVFFFEWESSEDQYGPVITKRFASKYIRIKNPINHEQVEAMILKDFRDAVKNTGKSLEDYGVALESGKMTLDKIENLKEDFDEDNIQKI